MKKIILTLLVAIGYLCMGCAKKDLALSQGVSATKDLSFNAVAANGSLGDTNIKYFGRWDFSNTTQYISYWGGAYIKVNFTGTTVKVKVGNTTNYYARIDNGPWVSYIGASETINLTPTPLATGTHTLSIAQGKDYSYVFNFEGLILDAGEVTSAPSTGTDLIEYIGDSITAGYTDPQANVSDYAWVCAEALGAEHTQIAYPGIALVNGFGLNTDKTGMDLQYFKARSLANANSPAWDFSVYTPKIIVINLGQNDNSTSVPDDTFQTDYISFLANVRAKFPNAEIFVMRTLMGVKAAPTLAAVNARIVAGDAKLHYIDTNGWLTPNTADYTGNSGVHPSVDGHIKVANLLKPLIAPYLTGGTPPAPVYLDHCDAISGWVSGITLSLNISDKKEGSGSLQAAGNSTLDFQKVFTPVNTGATAVNGSIRFWYYVSDVSQLGANNQVELGSGGTNDVNEYNWDIGPLNNGWNLITKTFASAGTTGGMPDLNAINWFRIYHTKTGSITTKIDALQILR
ncbi:SGNH/GDSL hydrolase family protein [Mucilaginibacter lappiensis]|uniref:Lysophospholipase L1-like esterase n=1 Tax=Mucilaginibacter lappiensis TaxID=354630 RepID=A0A841J6P1_9SPHI|nr:SGNH/GDSL hydrolase family protein [Mucilaginibacter lappiensis]MBB6126713.1 lysophospholipase L1-like esterase [Mucilaginibacter lappiensis]